MDIPKLNTSLIYFNQKETGIGPIAIDLSTSAFLPMLQFVLKNADTLCNCGDTEKCKCNRKDEMSEVAESDKSGLAACMECPLRESGQCEHWNGKEDDFGLLIGSTLTAKNISLVHNVCSDEQSGIHPDLLTMAEVWLDYNGAYASMDKKRLGIP